MSRSKKRSTDELEQLKNENRELKSTVKSLERQLKKLNKDFKTEFVQEELIKEEIAAKVPKCPKCGKGSIKEVVLGPRILQKCSVCTFTKVIKNGS